MARQKSVDSNDSEPDDVFMDLSEDAFAESSSSGPWPSPDADLLSADEDWWLVACMDWPRDRWLGYVRDYWKGAEVIVDHVIATGQDRTTSSTLS